MEKKQLFFPVCFIIFLGLCGCMDQSSLQQTSFQEKIIIPPEPTNSWRNLSSHATTDESNMLGIQITNGGDTELRILRFEIDGDILKTIDIPINATYKLIVDPEKYPRSIRHYINMTTESENCIKNSFLSLKYYANIEIDNCGLSSGSG